MIEIAFACPDCGQSVEGGLLAETTALGCPHCGHETGLPEAHESLEATPFGPCPVCGSEDLYTQKDFNRPLGIGLVVIGLGLGPFTHWISVAVAIVIDFVLYLIFDNVEICYACNAQYRGVPKAQRPAPFDIAIHDVYKFDRRHPPRREVAVAGPLQARLRRRGEAQ